MLGAACDTFLLTSLPSDLTFHSPRHLALTLSLTLTLLLLLMVMSQLPTCQVSLKNAEGQSLGVTLQHSNIVTKVTACWLGLGLGLGLGR